MNVEQRIQHLEDWRTEIDPKIEHLSKELGTNTSMTTDTKKAVDQLGGRLTNIEGNSATLLAIVSAGRIGGGALKWMLQQGANIVVILASMHFLK